MIETVFKCSGKNCGKTKGDANHWLIGRIQVNGADIPGFDEPWGYTLGPWDDHIARHAGVDHFCGRTCALAAINKLLDTRHQESHANAAETAACLAE